MWSPCSCFGPCIVGACVITCGLCRRQRRSVSWWPASSSLLATRKPMICVDLRVHARQFWPLRTLGEAHTSEYTSAQYDRPDSQCRSRVFGSLPKSVCFARSSSIDRKPLQSDGHRCAECDRGENYTSAEDFIMSHRPFGYGRWDSYLYERAGPRMPGQGEKKYRHPVVRSSSSEVPHYAQVRLFRNFLATHNTLKIFSLWRK